MESVWPLKCSLCGKGKSQQLVWCCVRILCSLWSNKLCLGSWIIPGCLGFCGSGFFRNCSHCWKEGVNLCLGYSSGHTLANSWQLFQRISRSVTLQDDTHPTLITQIRPRVRDLGFLIDHLTWASEGFGDQVETLESTYHRKWDSQKHRNWLVFLNKVSAIHWNGVQVVSWKQRWS